MCCKLFVPWRTIWLFLSSGKVYTCFMQTIFTLETFWNSLSAGTRAAWYLRPDQQPRQHQVHVGQEGGGQLQHGQGGGASSVGAGQIQHPREWSDVRCHLLRDDEPGGVHGWPKACWWGNPKWRGDPGGGADQWDCPQWQGGKSTATTNFQCCVIYMWILWPRFFFLNVSQNRLIFSRFFCFLQRAFGPGSLDQP